PPAPSGESTAAAAAPEPPPPAQPLFDADLGERLLAYVATLNLPQGQVDRAAESIENRFAFDANAVTRATLTANQQAWAAAIRQEPGLADLSPEINRTDFSTVYPQRVCLSEAPGAITIGALVNPDGTWRGEPTLLRSSGYGALDAKALREIKRHRFDPAEGIQAYTLTVETTVDYGPRPCIEPHPRV
ncbi:TonB family protein, partial [Nodosilinea sp. LEGE 07088]|uniref:TonB family protein n=1 Tax=Nodosilinea sp. LEGE 07088 TaxID=2777968 RepID=UPI00187F71DE